MDAFRIGFYTVPRIFRGLHYTLIRSQDGKIGRLQRYLSGISRFKWTVGFGFGASIFWEILSGILAHRDASVDDIKTLLILLCQNITINYIQSDFTSCINDCTVVKPKLLDMLKTLIGKDDEINNHFNTNMCDSVCDRCI
jgi:hypothetical protein